MKKPLSQSALEPGLLQVFRLYAWLQLASKLVFPLRGLLRGRAELLSNPNLKLALIFVSVHVLLLLAILYWPWLQAKLGRFFIPGALVIAASGVIIEQHLFSLNQFFWQLHPFLNILLILVAWQYNFSRVVLFTLGVALFETLLNEFFPLPSLLMLTLPNEQGWITYASLISRSITFLLLGYVVTRLVAAQRKQRQALADANQKLVSHAATLEQLAVSRERVRLSRELHDTLAHTLSAQAVQIEALLTVAGEMPGKARAMLEGMLANTRSGLDETRRALGALRASPLEDLGLVAAIRSLAEDFASRNDLELALDLPDEIDDLPLEIEQGYYRVTQEALENVARHARARSLALQLRQKAGCLALTIRDDGSGFGPQEARDEPRFGLNGMRERAEMIGADLEISSRTGEGTTVEMKLELGR